MKVSLEEVRLVPLTTQKLQALEKQNETVNDTLVRYEGQLNTLKFEKVSSQRY